MSIDYTFKFISPPKEVGEFSKDDVLKLSIKDLCVTESVGELFELEESFAYHTLRKKDKREFLDKLFKLFSKELNLESWGLGFSVLKKNPNKKRVECVLWGLEESKRYQINIYCYNKDSLDCLIEAIIYGLCQTKVFHNPEAFDDLYRKKLEETHNLKLPSDIAEMIDPYLREMFG